jgi:hypothetical protein
MLTCLLVLPTRSKATKPSIFANTDVIAGMNFRPALPDQNTAGGDFLPVKPFDAQPLGIAVPTVSGTSHSFFMRKKL